MTKFAACVVFCALPVAAQPSFTGIWETSQSDHVLTKIDQQGSAFAFINRQDGMDVSYKAVIGQDTQMVISGVPATLLAEWDGGTLVVHLQAEGQGRRVRMTSRYTLSGGGNTLTVEAVRKLNDDPEVQESHVYSRRPSTAWVNDPPPAPAEAVYKNIQIMKGVPAPRLPAVMNNLTIWLGVQCAHCHVQGHFESDDVPAKQTARKMFTMVRAINHDNFPGSDPVTCWTCHRGAARPQSLPAQ
jgi:hypothetical protein